MANDYVDREAVKMARTVLERDHDTNLATYCLRKTEVARRLGMTDLLWAMYNHGAAKSEVLQCIEEIEEELDG